MTQRCTKMDHPKLSAKYQQGVQQPGKPGILREFDLPQGKTWKTQGIFLPVYENFLDGLLFELLPNNDRKIICKNNDCI